MLKNKSDKFTKKELIVSRAFWGEIIVTYVVVGMYFSLSKIFFGMKLFV